MQFVDVLRRLADRDEADATSAAEIVAALNRSFPVERRAALLPPVAAAGERPPAEIPGIDWSGGAFHARTVEDVQRIVRFARANGRRVRVAGAQHSTTEAVYSPNLRDFRVVLDGSLRSVEFLSQDENGAVVQAGGGCYLGVNPSDPTSNWSNSLNGQLDARGVALPLLGGISHQTISGFLQTSSSGGSLRYGFASAVIGDPREHFTHFWNALLDLPGARLHWGKHLPDVGQKYGDVVFEPDLLKDRYPRLVDWLRLRRDSDPDGVFVTDYWHTILGI